MGITLKFHTAAIKKSAIRRHYPGGLTGFRRDHPEAMEDSYLFGVFETSGEHLLETLASISEKGLELAGCCVVGDHFVGEVEAHPHFQFLEIPSQSAPAWQVRLVDDDPEILAEDGARILRHIIRAGWSLALDGGDDV